MIETIAVYLYILGAYKSWLMFSSEDEDTIRARPYFAAFWPVVFPYLMLSNSLERDDGSDYKG